MTVPIGNVPAGIVKRATLTPFRAIGPELNPAPLTVTVPVAPMEVGCDDMMLTWTSTDSAVVIDSDERLVKTVGTGNMAVATPVRVSVCGEFAALVEMSDAVAVRVPAAAGVNVNRTVQVPEAFRDILQLSDSL